VVTVVVELVVLAQQELRVLLIQVAVVAVRLLVLELTAVQA
jgi:hypothetical protein